MATYLSGSVGRMPTAKLGKQKRENTMWMGSSGKVRLSSKYTALMVYVKRGACLAQQVYFYRNERVGSL